MTAKFQGYRMTRGQAAYYWALWRRVRAKLIADGCEPDDADEARKDQFHRAAFGSPVSVKAITKTGFTRIKAEFQAYLGDDDLDTQVAAVDPDRSAALYTLRSLARDLPGGVAYIDRVCADTNRGRTDWQFSSFPLGALLLLRNTINNRAAAARKKPSP